MSTPSIGVLVRVRSPGESVVHDLAAAGMHVERVMRRLGVVSGTVSSERLDELGSVAGVTAVERDSQVRTA